VKDVLNLLKLAHFHMRTKSKNDGVLQGAGKQVRPAGAIGVKHTVDWYRSDGKASAHAEWKAHMRDLLHKENSSSNPVRWYE
jgi:hypothetical protein